MLSYLDIFIKKKIIIANIIIVIFGITFAPNHLMAQDADKEQIENSAVDLLNTPHPISEEALKDIEKSLEPDKWVEVTRPMISCGATNDDPNLKDLLLETLIKSPSNLKLPAGCEMLRVGGKYMLDEWQTEEDTEIVVKMWAGVCPSGCLPTMTPVYAPPRRIVGAYLRPTTAPYGW